METSKARKDVEVMNARIGKSYVIQDNKIWYEHEGSLVYMYNLPLTRKEAGAFYDEINGDVKHAHIEVRSQTVPFVEASCK
jgi:hypothetical protein